MLITFLISTYNRREVLLQTLRRLVDCGLPREQFEIIIVDNASGDGTVDAIIEENLGVRLIAQQYSVTPQCIVVPEGMPVTFRATATDAIHGFVIGRTNANTMLVPGFVSTFTTTFPKAGEQLMPCHEYCGTGHEAMWAHVRVLPRDEFLSKAHGAERMSCVQR